MYDFLVRINLDPNGLRYIGPMAVGFIAVAAYRIGRKVIKGYLTLSLSLIAGITTFFLREPWIFPLVLIVGGLTTALASKEKGIWHHVKLNPPWKYVIIFGFIALGTWITSYFIDNRILFIFDHFYRYGYLVIGGGQVVIPYMFTDLVEIFNFMSAEEFLTGFGLVQGIPGPMFSFSAYAGGLAGREFSSFTQVMSALAAGLGIFLPGTLLIFFVYPMWEQLKSMKGIKLSLAGITAVAGGLITTAAIILMRESGFTIDNLIVFGLTVLLLLTKKVPAPMLVLLAIILGFVI
jgi:chromate transporter